MCKTLDTETYLTYIIEVTMGNGFLCSGLAVLVKVTVEVEFVLQEAQLPEAK